MRKSRFVIEDWLGPFPGYTDGQRWNGWATPSFEYEVALQIVEDWKATEWEGMEAYYDPEGDQFCFRSQSEDEWECFPSVTHEVDGQRHKLYPIGAYCWIWDEE